MVKPYLDNPHLPPSRSSVVGGRAAAPGMLRPEEVYLLYLLGRDAFQGEGVIADCGTYVGCSTFALGCGVRDNLAVSDAPGLVYAYDQFIADESYLVKSIRRDFGETLAVGSSFEKFFHQTIAPIADLVRVSSGDFMTMPPPERRIEILHIDVAKNEALHRRIVSDYFPRLIPGKSLIAHQDFYWYTLPHIPVSMEFLEPYFEVLEERVGSTRLYRLIRPIPQVTIDRAAKLDMSDNEKMLLLERAYERTSDPGGRALLSLTGFYLQARIMKARPGDDRARTLFRFCVEPFAEYDSRYYCVVRDLAAAAWGFQDVVAELQELRPA